MLSGKSQAGTAPYAMGSLLQAATYGATIPVIYGTTLSPLLAIWTANLRQGGSTKKFKQLKKGITAYCENIDFLLGHNPILGVLQMWNNGGTIPLKYTSVVASGSLLGAYTVKVGGVADPNFYAIVGVTITQTFSVTFDDYGGQGSQTFSGSYEVPFWNELHAGPDPTGNSSYRNWPYNYRWQPSYGADFFIDPAVFVGTNVNVYYAQLTGATSFMSPLAKERLTFEPSLGSGTEYSDADLSAQQIIYPMYAGVESSSIDLGSGGVIPSLTAEVQGKWGLYPSGDGDFADMIEDIFKSGVAQAAIGATVGTPGFTQVEHGLSGYNYPGCLQFKANTSVEVFTIAPLAYNLPVTEGNFLVAIASTTGVGGTAVSITDTGSNSWTAVFSGSPLYQVWYAKANASGPLTVTISGQGHDWGTGLLEIGGVDTFDSVSVGSGVTASITTTNTQGFPEYLLAISASAFPSGYTPPTVAAPLWDFVTGQNYYNQTPVAGYSIEERRVTTPGTYSITLTGSAPDALCILAFKSANPPNYPDPVGDFIDGPSLDQVRLQCRANGLWGSLSMSSQQAASDWLTMLYQAANAAAVYCGFTLFSQPLSEVSAVGNGVTYNAPTAGGPVYNLSTENGDFIVKSGNPIEVKTAARVDQPNVLQMQCLNRTSNYNPSVVEQPDAAGISLYGVRKADPIVNNAVQDVAIARQLLGIAVRKLQYGGDVYSFTLPAKWALLAPYGAGGGGNNDAVITITDPLANINQLPVRITSMTESADQELDCEAEPFVYGMYAPTPYTGTDVPAPYVPNVNTGAADGLQINPPIIFEATPRLAQQTSPAQIWIVTSCGAESIYGGCQCYISTDGGLSYNPAASAPAIGSAMQAEVGLTPFQNWPAGTDPDTTNNLNVSFALTLPDPPGTLPSFSPTQRDNFQFPCYVGFNNEATIDAEFVTGDTSQITQLGVLFSDPTLLNALPSDAVISNIFPMQFIEAGPNGSPVVSSIFSGTGLTPTSGGTLVQTITGGISAPLPTGGGAGIGTSLTAQEIRYNLELNTTGAGAFGQVTRIGWAIYYSSATPFIDPLTLIPFSPASGFGFGWAIPKTVATGMVGSGTNATVSAFGGIAPTNIPYEIMTYNEATLVMGGYELMATGSGNELRRGVYGAPAPGVGMNHPQGSPFALLNPSGVGMFKINMDPAWINTQLFFKFPTFNNFGALVTPLSDADFYTFTPTGIPGNIGPATGGIQVNGQ